MKNGHTEERGTKIAGGLSHIKEWHMLAFWDVPESLAGRATINHHYVLFVRVCLHTLTPPSEPDTSKRGRGEVAGGTTHL